MSAPQNPPAFSYAWNHIPGMTLRDWFAGQVLAACLAMERENEDGCSWKDVAESAYEIADAMLSEREGQKP